MVEPDGQSSETTGEESRACSSCRAEFAVQLVTRNLLGRDMVFGDRQECPSCRSAREELGAREAESQARLARLGVREDFRRRSGLPRKYWQKTFVWWEERGWPRSRAYPEARRWAEEIHDSPAGYRTLILYSRLPGAGKTILAACAINALVERWNGDPDRAMHSLRHTVGADLRKRGADIRDIQDVLRHADIGTTQIYTQMAREDLRKKLPRRFVDNRL